MRLESSSFTKTFPQDGYEGGYWDDGEYEEEGWGATGHASNAGSHAPIDP